jgi:hypothetical protein
MSFLQRTIIVLILALSSFGLAVSQAAAPDDFRVTIVAVTDFEDGTLRDQLLVDGIKDATGRLSNFFQEHYNITPQIFSVRDETSAESLRGWLFKDLPQDSSKTVHVIFVLTHGFSYKTPDPRTNKNEIFLASSDTYKSNYIGRAIRGSEFIDAFRNMPRRATVLFFLDSCGSGAIDGDNLQQILQHDPDFASRMLILASAMSNESAYSARFTRMLADLWSSRNPTPHCGRRAIESFLTTSLKSVPGVSQDVTQNVRLVAPLSPDFCIESLNYSNRLLFVSNASPGDISVTLQPADNPDSGDVTPVRSGEVAPFNLRPVAYTLIARRNPPDANSSAVVRTVDLSTFPAKVEVLFSSDPLDEANASEQAAQYLLERQEFPSAAADFRQASKVVLSGQIVSLDQTAVQLTVADSSLAADIDKADSELSAKKAQFDAAMQERDKLSRSTVGIVVQPQVLQEANTKVEQAEGNYKVALQRVEEDQARRAVLSNAKSETEARLVRVKSIINLRQQFDDHRNQVATVTDALIKELAPLFATTKSVRGVEIELDPVEFTTSKSERLRKLVLVLNNHPAAHIEIELLSPGANSLVEQVAIRKKAQTLKAQLQELGLASQYVVARGFMIGIKEHARSQIILSFE